MYVYKTWIALIYSCLRYLQKTSFQQDFAELFSANKKRYDADYEY